MPCFPVHLGKHGLQFSCFFDRFLIGILSGVVGVSQAVYMLVNQEFSGKLSKEVIDKRSVESGD